MHILNGSKVYGYEIKTIKGKEDMIYYTGKVWRLDDLSKVVYLHWTGGSPEKAYLASYYQQSGVRIEVEHNLTNGQTVMTWDRLDPKKVKCDKCHGSGIYHWGSGKFAKHGQCNHCQGNGYQTLQDKIRNANYIPRLLS